MKWCWKRTQNKGEGPFSRWCRSSFLPFFKGNRFMSLFYCLILGGELRRVLLRFLLGGISTLTPVCVRTWTFLYPTVHRFSILYIFMRAKTFHRSGHRQFGSVILFFARQAWTERLEWANSRNVKSRTSAVTDKTRCVWAYMPNTYPRFWKQHTYSWNKAVAVGVGSSALSEIVSVLLLGSFMPANWSNIYISHLPRSSGAGFIHAVASVFSTGHFTALVKMNWVERQGVP